jgi:filamentous hemagglutinin family protein
MRIIAVSSFAVSLFIVQPVIAQVIPDNTMGTNVAPNININGVLSDRVDGGAKVGNNLFHSFSSFNINPATGVYFTNPTDITNIFARVTGSNSSNINGTLGVLGGANLFLMNPNGIVFNSGAKLDLSGSFLATTASSIHFADGKVFEIKDTSSNILTQSVPVGLGFGSNSGKITVNGNGHNLVTQDPNFAPIINMGNTTGLHVQPGKTLALIASEVNLNGGILTAPQGKIELGSVSGNSNVSFSVDDGFNFGYTNVSAFEDIFFSNSSLLDASGDGGASIQINGRSIRFTDGSVALVQNQGMQKTGNLKVNASEILEIKGTAPDNITRSTIGNETLAGDMGNIHITAKRLSLIDGGVIANRTFSQSNGSHVYINATESLEVSGVSPVNPAAFSGIGSITIGSGDSGNVFISTPNLFISNGGIITATSLSSGNGGSININATDIELTGTARTLFQVSAIASSSIGSGNAGNINISTESFAINNGARIDTAGSGYGNGGSIVINARQKLQVLNGSGVDSSLEPATLEERQKFNLPEIPNRDSGNIFINTSFLEVANTGSISVSNLGNGLAGILSINADTVKLDNQGALLAMTASGNGGNITLESQNLILQTNSSITTNASGVGNGGNINLNIGAISLVENSTISANAAQQKGGNININTQGLFQSPDSTITATGATNGEIKITTPDIKQDNSLKQQATTFINAEQTVNSSCLANRNTTQNRFIVTGNGGIPQTPANQEIQYSLVQPKVISNVHILVDKDINSLSKDFAWQLGDRINEATQLVKTNDGRLLLTSSNTKLTSMQNLTCN